MKKVIFLLLLSFPIILIAQEEISWDFPVKPGSKEWNEIETSQEMINVCQIPLDVLSGMKTRELLEVCLRYPMFFDIHFANNLQDGLEVIFSSFNGFEELFQRNDYYENLFGIYSSEKLTMPHVDNNNRYRIYYLELMLSQTKIISELSEDQKDNLRLISLDKINKKRERKYSPYYQLGTALILTRIIDSSPTREELNSDDALSRFNKNGSLIDKDKITTIINLSENLK